MILSLLGHWSSSAFRLRLGLDVGTDGEIEMQISGFRYLLLVPFLWRTWTNALVYCLNSFTKM